MSQAGVYEVERAAVEGARWRLSSTMERALDGWVTVRRAEGDAAGAGTLLVWEQVRDGGTEVQVSGVLVVGELSIPLASELAVRAMELAKRTDGGPSA